MSTFEKSLLAIIASIGSLISAGLYFGPPEPPPAAPYSVPVPSPIPPPMGPGWRPCRPFVAQCPYCRRTMTVTPPANVGELGEIVEDDDELEE